MFSRDDSLKKVLGGYKNYTIASTFEKAKSLKFELLFGEYQARTDRRDSSDGIVRAVDYHFASGQVFGFEMRSLGEDFKTFRHAFVLQACAPGDVGFLVAGIAPGARILVQAGGETMCSRLIGLLKKLRSANVVLHRISDEKYCRLNQLLNAKMNTEYWAGDLIYEVRVG